MAGVSVESGGKGGKKPVDSNVNMIPFIDLLVCCISFLIITAVWTQLERLNATQQSPGQQSQQDPPQEERIRLFKLAWDATGTQFGQRMLHYERYYAGDPVRVSAAYHAAYNVEPLLAMVKRALATN